MYRGNPNLTLTILTRTGCGNREGISEKMQGSGGAPLSSLHAIMSHDMGLTFAKNLTAICQVKFEEGLQKNFPHF